MKSINSLFVSIFLLVIAVPVFAFAQSISVNSTYRFTPNGETIVFWIVENKVVIDSNGYSTVSSAKVALNTLQTGGHTGAYIIETTLSKSESAQKGITITPSLYEQALANVNANNPITSTDLWNQAMTYYETSSTNISVRSLAQLIKQNPKDPKIASAKYYLGTIYYGRYFSRSLNKADVYGQWEYLRAAYQLFNDVISNYSGDTIAPSAQLQLGYCKQAMAHFGASYVAKMADAVNTFKNAADTQPATDDNAKAKAQLMYCNYLFELGANHKISWDTVSFELAKVKNYPNANRAYGSRAMAMTAETYYFDWDYSKMQDCAVSAMNTYPEIVGDMALNRYIVARSNLEMGNYATAQSQFTLLLSTYGDSTISDPIVSLCRGGALLGKAICYLNSKDSTNFQATINELVQTNPKSAEAKVAQKRWKDSIQTPSPSLIDIPMPIPNSDIILTQGRVN